MAVADHRGAVADKETSCCICTALALAVRVDAATSYPMSWTNVLHSRVSPAYSPWHPTRPQPAACRWQWHAAAQAGHCHKSPTKLHGTIHCQCQHFHMLRHLLCWRFAMLESADTAPTQHSLGTNDSSKQAPRCLSTIATGQKFATQTEDQSCRAQAANKSAPMIYNACTNCTGHTLCLVAS